MNINNTGGRRNESKHNMRNLQKTFILHLRFYILSLEKVIRESGQTKITINV